MDFLDFFWIFLDFWIFVLFFGFFLGFLVKNFFSSTHTYETVRRRGSGAAPVQTFEIAGQGACCLSDTRRK